MSKKTQKRIKKYLKSSEIKQFSRCFYFIVFLRERWTSLKKYYKFLIFPAIIIIIAGIFSGFSEQSNDKTVENLLKKRTVILQDAYYGKIETDKAEQYLNEIETYPLLSEDIQGLRNADLTQMDIVNSMEFLSINKTLKMFDFISYNTKIRWYMSGLSADYISDNQYSVVIKSTKEGFKISEFKAK